jgi:hypothetical protein
MKRMVCGTGPEKQKIKQRADVRPSVLLLCSLHLYSYSNFSW